MTKDELNFEKLEKKYNEQIAIRIEKLKGLQEEGKNPFDVYTVERTHVSSQIEENYDELEGKNVTVAGRLMSKEYMGKQAFQI